ncbi:extracellular solute-binding protein [candidate division KSB1 bacterium]|nr:extracellular solute-binding protein [candidate division KSB1 bacterium]NIR73275.1 extracellular solute-binding protein [candidate division KSB1 bacterium]NIS26981.1 extracellular solute-binding protein [candidate division KSB1 bacterium]NIT73821.1 extracellular solute-binding protein [candidate division KSB1 bacterium]NIU27726.1 extracellular solute-binding protein [candidate division KSB1 bacterium]
MNYPKIALRLFVLFILFIQVQTGLGQKKPIANVLYAIIQESGGDAAIKQYRDLKANHADEYDFSEPQLNRLGYKLMGETKHDAALKVFKLNVEMFPNSPNVYDSLGECYLVTGRHERAARNYKKALKILADTDMPANRKKFLENNAKMKLLEAENFEPKTAETLNYVAYYGGVPASKWDMKNLVEFQKQHPEVKMSYDGNNLYSRPVPHSVPAKLAPDFKADVISSFVGGVYREFVEKDRIADISNLWKEEGWDDQFPESFKRMVTYKGKQYFVPQAFQFNPIFYRKDIFKKHGWQPPKSWDDLLQLCDEINAAGYSPFTVSAQGWPPPVARWFTILNLRLNGPEFHEQVMRGKVAFTDPKIKNVFQYWAQLFEHNAFSDSSGWNNYQKGIQEITSGKAVMYNLGEWLYESLNDEQKELFDFFAVPEINPDVKQAEIVHTYGAFIVSNSRHPRQARALLRFLGSKESQRSNVKELSRINANVMVDQKHYTDVQRRLFEHVKNTEILVPLFEFNTEAKLAEAGIKTFVAFWRHPENVDQILEDWEAKRLEIKASN